MGKQADNEDIQEEPAIGTVFPETIRAQTGEETAPGASSLPVDQLVEKSSADRFLFTPRIRPERRAEAFLEEWVRHFTRA